MLLCDVNNFKQAKAINKMEEIYFSKNSGEGICLSKLKRQHNGFRRALEKHHIKPIVIESNKNCPEQVFVRDVAFKVENTWCICNMSTDVRAPETAQFIKFLKEKGQSYYQFKSHIEGGDVVIWNKTIFVGIGARTSKDSIPEMCAQFPDYDIIPITLSKDILHLDCVLGIVNNTAVVYKPGIDKNSYTTLSKLFNLIEITLDEQESMATNFLWVGNVVFCEKANKRVNLLIKSLGLTVEEVEFNEFHKLGGSLRCCSLEYIVESYIHKNYLHYENNQLYYKDINLLSLVSKYGCPIKVGYPEMVKERIIYLKNIFNKYIQVSNYKGRYFYATANKASYYAENVITAGKFADFYEVSSVSDLAIVERVLSKKIVKKKKIICNGIKDLKYLSLMCKLVDKGYEILNIVDSVSEFENILKYPFKNTLEIGLRVKVEDLYEKNPKIVKYNRFGLYKKEVDYILKTYKKNPKLNLTTVHYHQRSSRFDTEKYLTNLSQAFSEYVRIASKEKSVTTFDIGGGCPYDKIEEYDYVQFAKITIDTIKQLSLKYGVAEPDIIQENGRYTVSDACFNIYKINTIKYDDKPWYITDDSFMTSLPNSWALQEDFLILPINLIENKQIPVRLAGDTCDGDDVYYYQSKEELLLPEIKDGQTLYIGIFGMGAYQEILSGIGGIHHCLNREEHDLIIYKKKNKNHFYYVRHAQTINYLFKRLLYKNKKNMNRFK